MGWSSSALTYAVLRTVLAVALVLVAAVGTRRAWPMVGQAVADAACTAFMLAYVDVDLRELLGWLAAPLVAYVVAWEGWGALREAAATDTGPWDGTRPDLLAWFGGIWRVSYRILFVTPPVVAGGFLVFASLYPGEWIFPSMPAPLRCAPDTLTRGDTLTLRMVVPHGGEPGVFTPSRGSSTSSTTAREPRRSSSASSFAATSPLRPIGRRAACWRVRPPGTLRSQSSRTRGPTCFG